MKVRLKLARIGMNMEEGTIVEWHKKEGEAFQEGDILYSVETEKVTQEVDAPGAGVLAEILVEAGDIAEVGEDVCIVESD
jgi:pyruvate dehydrogenase E2 component (dihydrolipoamide acetyltransferase)|tara:strand:+ start:128 stop:367 length:240 start_codon:yes stop_codon:yes gene_type:complete